MRNVMICLFAVFLAAPTLGQEQAKKAPAKNVILFGWDGAQRNHVNECLERGELPTLKMLSEKGGLVPVDVITGATDTKAGWSQILTGYHPEVTGVYSNGKYHDIPEGLSLFERLEKHFGTDEFITVAVIGKSGHCGEIKPPSKKPLGANAGSKKVGNQPKPNVKQPGKKLGKKPGKKPVRKPARKRLAGKIVEENGVKYVVFGGSPYYTMHKSCDIWEYGLAKDVKVGTRAIELLEKHKDKPFFFFVHFAEVDHSGHGHGENSKEYNDALISNDTWTGKILEKLKELKLCDKTSVFVTADHGFDEGGKSHKYAPFVFLGSNDPCIKRDGMRQDIAPTILSAFGLDLNEFEPKLDGEPLSATATKPVKKAPEKRMPILKKKPQSTKKKAA